MHALDAKAVEIVRQQVRKGLNAPHTSSMGRLFDAVSSLGGV
jgi:hydrogenase maturation factor HypF (carbamoyltransferase family)